jgi:hypothetical protein
MFISSLKGLTALMRQKIAEICITTGRVPGEIDWAIIPDASIYDHPMDIHSDADEWEDIVEEDLGDEGQMVDPRVVQQARLQTIITCVTVVAPAIAFL